MAASPECFSIVERKGDLFSSNDNLGHCVSRDYAMGAGIAVHFKRKFKNIEKLKAQNANVGGCSVLKINGRYIFYLVTKERYYQKPTYENLIKSLQALRGYCRENNITSFSIPRIGCGLDKLKWIDVKEILIKLFQDENMHITVYSL